MDKLQRPGLTIGHIRVKAEKAIRHEIKALTDILEFHASNVERVTLLPCSTYIAQRFKAAKLANP